MSRLGVFVILVALLGGAVPATQAAGPPSQTPPPLRLRFGFYKHSGPRAEVIVREAVSLETEKLWLLLTGK